MANLNRDGEHNLKPPLIVKICIAVVLIYILYQIVLITYFVVAGPFSIHASDISRRFTSPDGKKTALLVREYAFDLNFRLYVVDHVYDSPGSKSYLWSSHDYDPDPSTNWHEDLQWKKDSSVVAVTIDGKYVFAYDFNTGEKIEDEETIKQYLMLWHQP